MPKEKKPAVRIVMYTDPKGAIRYRWLGRNEKNLQHSYNRKESAFKTITKIITAITEGDYEIVDKTKRRRAPRVEKRT